MCRPFQADARTRERSGHTSSHSGARHRRIPRLSMYHARMRADLLRGHVDALLLAVLAEAPGHGYELNQRLLTRSGGELDVNEGSLYPALHRLERRGLVESEWSAGGGRKRRVYRL